MDRLRRLVLVKKELNMANNNNGRNQLDIRVPPLKERRRRTTPPPPSRKADKPPKRKKR